MGLFDDMRTVFRHVTKPKKRSKLARKSGVWVAVSVAFAAAVLAVRGMMLMTKNVSDMGENVTSGGSNYSGVVFTFMLASLVAVAVFVTVFLNKVFRVKR
jgi:hypothetical protein